MNIESAIRAAARRRLLPHPEKEQRATAYMDRVRSGEYRLQPGVCCEITFWQLFAEGHLLQDVVSAAYLIRIMTSAHAKGIGQILPIRPREEVMLPAMEAVEIGGAFSIDPASEAVAPAGWLRWDPAHPISPNIRYPVFEGLDRAPLVIGPCSPERLFRHLIYGRTFCRAPGGSEWLYLYGVREAAIASFRDELFQELYSSGVAPSKDGP